MNKADYILAFLVSVILGLWGLIAYHSITMFWLMEWRFTGLFFGSFIILLAISILDLGS